MKHVLGFSGGIDSQAAAAWLLDRYDPVDVILTNADAGGNEHPITSEFIRWFSARVHPVITISATVADMAGRGPQAISRLGLMPSDSLSFLRLAQIKGCWPASQSQFCTTHLKLEPMRRWAWQNGAANLNYVVRHRDGTKEWKYGRPGDNEGVLSEGWERYVGVRRDESRRRRDLDARVYDDMFMCWLNRPLLEWSKSQCFEFVRSRGQKWNPLYDMGFRRVGCAPCVNSSKEDIRRWAAAPGDMIGKVRSWEQITGRTFFPPIIPDGRGGQRRGWIDEVVQWARTERGGTQISLPLLESDLDAGICSNQFGFCE